ncbi:MAG: GNAT family N-acetyltransferase [Sphingomonas sp.]
MLKLVPLTMVDPKAVETLLDQAFGADRHGRTAYRVRDGTHADPVLSFAALDPAARDRLVATIQCWPVRLACDAGDVHPMTMVGPVAVVPTRQRDGIGKLLMIHMLAAAHDAGADPALMLIGDPGYYERFFGFSAAHTGGWRLPGPVERHRLLARGANVPDCAGELGPRLGSSDERFTLAGP